MDRNFQRALKLVLKHEGGWSDHPKDPGGATMKGVTLANFRRYVKADANKDDLRKITDEQIATVYRRFYWDAIAGAELPGGVDYAVFDFAVNSGPARAAKYLQKIVGAKVDGRVGPATIAATKNMMRATIIHDLCDARMGYLQGLKKLWPTFKNGWTIRVADVRGEALALAALPDKQPPVKIEIPVEVEKPTVPQTVEEKVKEKTSLWSWLTSIFGGGALGLGWLTGMDWQAIIAGGVVLIGVVLVLVALRSQIIAAVKGIREAVEAG